jgi:hypothetical protein
MITAIHLRDIQGRGSGTLIVSMTLSPLATMTVG